MRSRGSPPRTGYPLGRMQGRISSNPATSRPGRATPALRSMFRPNHAPGALAVVERGGHAPQIVGEMRDLFGAENGLDGLVDPPERQFDPLQRGAAILAQAKLPGARIGLVAHAFEQA